MAEIITKDSEEFKELTGWMKKIGKSVEAASKESLYSKEKWKDETFGNTIV